MIYLSFCYKNMIYSSLMDNIKKIKIKIKEITITLAMNKE